MMDGHIHSPYCPHGTSDPIKSYIEKGISLGYKTMTFTEHAPLPPSFEDPVPEKDSSMAKRDVEKYVSELKSLKQTYKRDIQINIGFEVDYIEGFEKETESFLNEYGPELDDSILSVHFLKGKNEWYCLDYSPDMFQKARDDFGSIEALYEEYFSQIIRSAEANLGIYKPKRIGHFTLVKKFQQLFPSPTGWEQEAQEVLKVIKQQKLALDYNGAGMKKPHCQETYPPLHLAIEASQMGIPLIYGSDAHSIKGLKQGYEEIDTSLLTDDWTTL
ncbi:histidinol-phosphatase HisJ [Halobacillus fulvus]|nr:histidinol-phosphatase HisJ [Halobacillus fulvus]